MITVYLSKLHCNINSHIFLHLTNIFLLCRFSTKFLKVFYVSICATYNTHFMDLVLNTLIVVVISEDTDCEASNTVCPLYDDFEYGRCCGMAWWM